MGSVHSALELPDKCVIIHYQIRSQGGIFERKSMIIESDNPQELFDSILNAGVGHFIQDNINLENSDFIFESIRIHGHIES